jgi:hypothetical protein
MHDFIACVAIAATFAMMVANDTWKPTLHFVARATWLIYIAWNFVRLVIWAERRERKRAKTSRPLPPDAVRTIGHLEVVR